MNAIYWLLNDLRLHDNHTFGKACEEADEGIPVYIFNSQEKKGFFQNGISPGKYAGIACTIAKEHLD